jgi:hypothetical protein
MQGVVVIWTKVAPGGNEKPSVEPGKQNANQSTATFSEVLRISRNRNRGLRLQSSVMLFHTVW